MSWRYGYSNPLSQTTVSRRLSDFWRLRDEAVQRDSLLAERASSAFHHDTRLLSANVYGDHEAGNPTRPGPRILRTGSPRRLVTWTRSRPRRHHSYLHATINSITIWIYRELVFFPRYDWISISVAVVSMLLIYWGHLYLGWASTAIVQASSNFSPNAQLTLCKIPGFSDLLDCRSHDPIPTDLTAPIDPSSAESFFDALILLVRVEPDLSMASFVLEEPKCSAAEQSVASLNVVLSLMESFDKSYDDFLKDIHHDSKYMLAALSHEQSLFMNKSSSWQEHLSRFDNPPSWQFHGNLLSALQNWAGNLEHLDAQIDAIVGEVAVLLRNTVALLDCFDDLKTFDSLTYIVETCLKRLQLASDLMENVQKAVKSSHASIVAAFKNLDSDKPTRLRFLGQRPRNYRVEVEALWYMMHDAKKAEKYRAEVRKHKKRAVFGKENQSWFVGAESELDEEDPSFDIGGKIEWRLNCVERQRC